METKKHKLETFADLPKGCFAHPVRDNAHWPLIQAGEFAVVDGADAEYVSGRLYLFRYEGRNGRDDSFHIWEVKDCAPKITGGDEPCVWLSPTNKPSNGETLDDWIEQGRQFYLSDGPMYLKAFPEYSKGRVIGVLRASEQRRES